MADWHNDLSESGFTIWRAVSGLAESGSQVEARAWAVMLNEALVGLLLKEDDVQLNTILTVLQQNAPELHEILSSWVEAAATKTDRDRPYVSEQLMALPVLTWSRFNIPTTEVGVDHLNKVHEVLCQEVLAEGVDLTIVNKWFSPEQLPQSYSAALTRLKSITEKRKIVDLSKEDFVPAEAFLCDVRYLLLKVRLPRNGALFRWQVAPFDATKSAALMQLQAVLESVFVHTLPGCVSQAMLPDSLFTAWKAADMASREYAVRAAATFLSMALEESVDQLIATVAIFERDEEFEIRVGFTSQSLPGIQYGLIWPLWGNDLPSQQQAVNEVLLSLGLLDVVHIQQTFSCLEDDGLDSPAYVDVDGQVVEAMMPESAALEVSLH